MAQDDNEEQEYEYYFVHDSIGVSHVMRRPKGSDPRISCTNCDD